MGLRNSAISSRQEQLGLLGRRRRETKVSWVRRIKAREADVCDARSRQPTPEVQPAPAPVQAPPMPVHQASMPPVKQEEAPRQLPPRRVSAAREPPQAAQRRPSNPPASAPMPQYQAPTSNNLMSNYLFNPAMYQNALQPGAQPQQPPTDPQQQQAAYQNMLQVNQQASILQLCSFLCSLCSERRQLSQVSRRLLKSRKRKWQLCSSNMQNNKRRDRLLYLRSSRKGPIRSNSTPLLRLLSSSTPQLRLS